jgi:hypothetical protein
LSNRMSEGTRNLSRGFMKMKSGSHSAITLSLGGAWSLRSLHRADRNEYRSCE